MDFQEAEQRFRAIDEQYRAGEISAQAYRSQIQRLHVTDASGRLWMMQESTGRWHVFDQGRWRAASPPGVTVPRSLPERGPTSGAPRKAVGIAPTKAAARATSRAAGKQTPGPTRWLVIGSVAVLLLACVGLIGGGVFVASRVAGGLPEIAELAGLSGPDEVSERPAEEPEATPAPPEMTVKETLTVADDGSPVRDEVGTVVALPEGSLPDDVEAELVAHRPPQPLLEVLDDAYRLESPLYAVNSRTTDDGVGQATLALPAASPDARVLAVIDGRALALLNVQPKGGKLTIKPPLGAVERTDQHLGSSIVPGGTLHYAVIEPSERGDERRGGPGQAAGLPAPDPRDCGLALHGLAEEQTALFRETGCRQNAAGTVLVSYHKSDQISSDVADAVVDATGATVTTYAGLKFTGAELSKLNPLHVRILDGGADSTYWSASEIVCIPLERALTIAGEGRPSLMHEIAHWVQDDAYNMAWGNRWEQYIWWLEVAAENMMMLADPSIVDRNMNVYGNTMAPGKKLVLQSAPYQWPEFEGEWPLMGEPAGFYVQAQLVKVNMCNDTDVCPLSKESFVRAINEGTYPFNDDAARRKVNANLDDYARYLLGAAPERANTAMPLTGPVQSGDGVGAFVRLHRSTVRKPPEWNFLHSGERPQQTVEGSGAAKAMVIDAPLEKDGVYPLLVQSGVKKQDGTGGGATYPAALRIAPGPPFWYRAGDQAATFHDGTKELVIQPIHLTMGLPKVRVVALGREGGEHFRARVEQVDLSGVWVLQAQQQVSATIECTGVEDVDSAQQAELNETIPELNDLGVKLIRTYSLLGDYSRDAKDPTLHWSLVEERIPEGMDPTKFTYTGIARLRSDDVKVEANATFDFRNKDDSGAGAWARAVGTADGAGYAPGLLATPDSGTGRNVRALMALLVLAGAGPVAVVMQRRDRRGRRSLWRWLPLVAVIGAGSVVLVACLTVEFWGDAQGQIGFKKLEYVGGEGSGVVGSNLEFASKGDPLWRLEDGRGTFNIDLSVLIATEEEGSEVKTPVSCQGQATYDVTGAIYEDVEAQSEE